MGQNITARRLATALAIGFLTCSASIASADDGFCGRLMGFAVVLRDDDIWEQRSQAADYNKRDEKTGVLTWADEQRNFDERLDDCWFQEYPDLTRSYVCYGSDAPAAGDLKALFHAYEDAILSCLNDSWSKSLKADNDNPDLMYGFYENGSTNFSLGIHDLTKSDSDKSPLFSLRMSIDVPPESGTQPDIQDLIDAPDLD